MSSQSISWLLLIPGLVGTCASLWMAIITARKKPGVGWQYLVCGGLAVAAWCAGQVMWVLISSEQAALRITQLQYCAITLASLLWLLHALAQTGRRRWLRPHWIALMSVMPAITIVIALSYEPGYKNLLLRGFRLPPETVVPEAMHGPWFWLFMTHTHLPFLAGCVLLLFHYAQSMQYRDELLIMAAFPLLLLGMNLLFISGHWPMPLDPSPLGFALGFSMFGWAMQRRGMFELRPVGWRMAIESLEEGIVIVDATGRIIDSNPAALRLLRNDSEDVWSQAMQELLADSNWTGGATPMELDFPMRDGRTRRMQIGVVALRDSNEAFCGSVISLRDVTRERTAQQQLLGAHGHLRKLYAELERISQIDPLTGLANRRVLFDRLDEEFARARRYGKPLALLLIDLDLFKHVNDTHGHLTGDAVLGATGKALIALKRPADLIARYGGEELVMLLPETDPDGARSVAARAWQSLREIAHQSGNGSRFQVTASIGVASAGDAHGGARELLAQADAALYAAKNAGRDRIAIALVDGFEIFTPQTPQTQLVASPPGAA
jgi:diguanylate cyclase (GGDEF)-like protein/PAS domain S-box-containing protein